jgi:hypothetical protein
MTSVPELTYEIIKRYPHLLGHINTDELRFIEYSSDTAPPFVIQGLSKAAINLLSDTDLIERYTCVINPETADSCSINQLQWIILEQLLGIAETGGGKYFPPNFNTYSPIVNAISLYQLGADYLDHPGLPDLLGEKPVNIF